MRLKKKKYQYKMEAKNVELKQLHRFERGQTNATRFKKNTNNGYHEGKEKGADYLKNNHLLFQ